MLWARYDMFEPDPAVSEAPLLHVLGKDLARVLNHDSIWVQCHIISWTTNGSSGQPCRRT